MCCCGGGDGDGVDVYDVRARVGYRRRRRGECDGVLSGVLCWVLCVDVYFSDCFYGWFCCILWDV